MSKRFLAPWKDSAEYRWSSYGEAVGGGTKGNGKKAREGLVRACMSHQGTGFEAEKWKEVSRIYRRAMGLALGRKSGRAEVDKRLENTNLNTFEALEAGGTENGTVLPDLGMARMLRCRIRYFTDGAVIGSREFVNETFAAARERFTAKRKCPSVVGQWLVVARDSIFSPLWKPLRKRRKVNRRWPC